MKSKTIAGECPNCGSLNSILVDTDFSSGKYLDNMECEDCLATWQELFAYNTFIYKEGTLKK